MAGATWWGGSVGDKYDGEERGQPAEGKGGWGGASPGGNDEPPGDGSAGGR